ncbi:uncharacterized protein EV154DRAFT_570011 [Mucor mucedo]|uniref:uncharacterized protein n=1 Tax=Mucor mucedo TaxID=29922 RepID=UPI00221E3A4C|nr:uncharacterized protein EV154DRAFT_570011 [Mucor mucedo]KAI7873576.1 hypothetical protein EV154DRAFT_570011 [Mucor mucedo]
MFEKPEFKVDNMPSTSMSNTPTNIPMPRTSPMPTNLPMPPMPHATTMSVLTDDDDAMDICEEHSMKITMAMPESPAAKRQTPTMTTPPADIVFGKPLYQSLNQVMVARLDALRAVFPLNEQAPTLVLRYYASDIWSMLQSSSKYVPVDLVEMSDFVDAFSILKLAERDDSGQVRVKIQNVQVDTGFQYFCLVFPVPDDRPFALAHAIVDGRVQNPFKKVGIRRAYVYYMASVMMDGRGKEATDFHQLLQRAIFDTFRIIP